MFLRLKFPLAAFLIGFSLLLSGCNEGTNTEPTIKGATDFSLPDEPLPPFESNAIVGEPDWDFLTYGPKESLKLYRVRFASGVIGSSEHGGIIHSNLFAADDNDHETYSTAVLSVEDRKVLVHSRVNGSTMLLYELPSLGEACAVEGYADRDLSAGTVFVTMSGKGRDCSDSPVGARHLWINFDKDGVNLVTTLSMKLGSVYANPIYDDSGLIDAFIVTDLPESRAAVYDRDGSLLREISGVEAWPLIAPIGGRGVTRDDRYLGISRDGNFYTTTLSQFIETGLAGVPAQLTDLGIEEFLSGPPDFYTSIVNEGRVFQIDQITRSVEKIADFSGRYKDGWELLSASRISENYVMVLKNEGLSKVEAWHFDSQLDSLTLILEDDGQQAVLLQTNEHAFFNYRFSTPIPDPVPDPIPEIQHKANTAVIDSDGNVEILEGFTAVGGVPQISQGSNESQIFGMLSQEYSEGPGFVDPEIWKLDATTGRLSHQVASIQDNCYSFSEDYSIGDRALFSFGCSNGYRYFMFDPNSGRASPVRVE